MGIDFTWKGREQKEKTASWAYSGFNRFRERLAEAVGIKLREMQGFTPHNLKDQEREEWDRNSTKWDSVKHPLKIFLNHSDCDGQLSALRCAKMAPEIEKIIKTWDVHDYDRTMGEVLAKNMRRCAKLGVPLIFT